MIFVLKLWRLGGQRGTVDAHGAGVEAWILPPLWPREPGDHTLATCTAPTLTSFTWDTGHLSVLGGELFLSLHLPFPRLCKPESYGSDHCRSTWKHMRSERLFSKATGHF